MNNLHTGNPQDAYNHIQNASFRAELRAEAEYILEEQATGEYKLTKKPNDETLTQVTNALDFAASHDNKILIERIDGTYERFNFNSVEEEKSE